MFNIGPGELLAILAVALIVLGPNRLPEAVRTVGRVVGQLRRISSSFQDELRHALDDSDVIDPVEPTPASNKETELVDSSAAALVEATASTATPAGSEDTVDDDLDLDDFGDDLDSPDQPVPVPGAADAGGPGSEPEPVGDTDEPARSDEPVVLDMPADDAPPTGNGASDDPDDRGAFDHIEALEALDPGRGAEADIAGSAAADAGATESDNGVDADAGADDSRAAS